jgi:hypothetical protein
MHIMNMEHTILYFQFRWIHFSYVYLLSHAEPSNSLPDINMVHISVKEIYYYLYTKYNIQILKRVVSIQWNEIIKNNWKIHARGHNHKPMPLSYPRWRLQNLFKGYVSWKCSIVPTQMSVMAALFVLTFPMPIK